MTRGKGSSNVTTTKGYDLSSRRSTLKGGLYSCMRLCSRKRASTSPEVTIHSRSTAFCAISHVLIGTEPLLSSEKASCSRRGVFLGRGLSLHREPTPPHPQISRPQRGQERPGSASLLPGFHSQYPTNGSLGPLDVHRHSHDMVSRVHVEDFTCSTLAPIRQETQCRPPDVLLSHVSLKRRIHLMPIQHAPKTPYARGSQSADRPSRDGVHSDPPRSQVNSQVTYASFKCRLGYSHDIVVGDDSLPAQIGHGQNAAPVVHDPCHDPRGSHKEIRRHIQRQPEPLTRGVQKGSLELLSIRKCHRMHKEIQAPPFLSQGLPHSFQLVIVLDVARNHQVRVHFVRQGSHPSLQRIANIGEA